MGCLFFIHHPTRFFLLFLKVGCLMDQTGCIEERIFLVAAHPYSFIELCIWPIGISCLLSDTSIQNKKVYGDA